MHLPKDKNKTVPRNGLLSISSTSCSRSTILVTFLIISIKCDHSIGSVQVSQQEHPKYEQIALDKVEQIDIPKDQIPLVRLPSNTLLKYTAYKDVSILHFRIPPDTRTALFTFKAYEESKSAFRKYFEHFQQNQEKRSRKTYYTTQLYRHINGYSPYIHRL